MLSFERFLNIYFHRGAVLPSKAKSLLLEEFEKYETEITLEWGVGLIFLLGRFYFKQIDFAINRIVNPDGEDIATIAPGIGGGIERVLRQSDAKTVFGLDFHHYVHPDSTLEETSQVDRGDYEGKSRKNYFTNTWGKGFANGWRMNKGLYEPITWEVENMGASITREEHILWGQEHPLHIWHISLDWQHPDKDEKRERDVYLVGGVDLNYQNRWIKQFRSFVAAKNDSVRYYVEEGHQSSWHVDENLLVEK